MSKIIYLLPLLFYISCNKGKTEPKTNLPKIDYKWIQKTNETNAREKIDLILSGNFMTEDLYLGLSNDFGSSVITPRKRDANTFIFTIPKSLSKISGVLSYSLSYNNHVIDNGNINILPLNTALLETYCGPSHMVASLIDYSMIVVIPNDIYDNPNSGEHYTVEFDTKTKIEELVQTDELLSHRRIYSRQKKGKVLAKAYIDTIKSKVSDIIILANNATDFTISYTRNTSFSDGKELTTLKTSVIRDGYDNIIENGTMVNFYLTFNKTHLKIHGKVINGIATAQFVHPEIKREYSVQAFIENVSTSNIINIKYTTPNF
ncbi:hypothetical protein SAMN04489761_1102 [Tenacibaculum sp. MAR_2009_124]|uniref:hypothetical protein n=1 Tax=Tenacibaculum sp. MAR_2009_124 TaxID=1250059 RepID=UPI00089C4F1C|nr:hypothetical protein [Tenacibaculum sp. MAR_2009_124]SEB50647.1 hypothetical protein SAMN04489761_1102 [Tenacibaculum sp. MAR_2009_124]